jgi:hypothetical protein
MRPMSARRLTSTVTGLALGMCPGYALFRHHVNVLMCLDSAHAYAHICALQQIS